MVYVKKASPEAQLPTRNTPSDAGADIYSIEDVTIQPGERKFVDTGIILQAVHNADTVGGVSSYFRIAPRSGLAFKNGIMVLAGVVDIGYTGTIKVGLYNSSNAQFEVTKGMKIAQIIRELCILDEFIEVSEVSETERGAKGFGSSGTYINFRTE